ncbi:hypothetical protein LAHI110946_08875 [Lactococcus hircilactis]
MNLFHNSILSEYFGKQKPLQPWYDWVHSSSGVFAFAMFPSLFDSYILLK